MLRVGLGVFFLSATVALGTTVDVSITGFAFSPSSISITQGDTVRWTNNDPFAHTSTSNTGFWDSSFLGQGSTFTHVFTSIGTFPYHCNVHPFMTASVTVTAAPPPGTTLQITANAVDDLWGDRKRTTRNGKILWYDDTAVWLYDGMNTIQVQVHDTLGDVTDTVFALGTGSTAGEVIGAWRRGTDVAWITINGNPPVQVSGTNPINPALPTNPEAVAIDDRCVFMTLQAFSGGQSVQHIFRVDPVTGAATNLTGTSAVPGRSSQISTSQCNAVWLFDDRPIPVTGQPNYKLHYYNGSTVSTIDTDGSLGPPYIDQGKIVYTKKVNGAVNVYLYDTNLGSPSIVRLTSYTSPSYTSLGVQTDGRHVAFTRETNTSFGRAIALAGGAPYTDYLDSSSRPFDGPLAGQSVFFPFQLDHGQFFWKNYNGAYRVGDASGVSTLNIAPATSIAKPWLADAYLAWLGTSNDGGTDIEVFRQVLPALTTTSPPLAIVANPMIGAITVAWEEILGATSYNLYMAEVTGVTKGTYASLTGGRKFTGVTQPYTIEGLKSDKQYYFTVTSIEAAVESASSRETSTTSVLPGWATAYRTEEVKFNDVRTDLQDGNTLYAAATDSVGVWKSTDGGNAWAQLSGTVNGRDVRAVGANGPIVIAVTKDGDILLSTDSGTSWNVAFDGEDISEQQKSLLINPTNPNTIYVGDTRIALSGASNYVVKSTDGGATWAQLPDSAAGELRAYTLSFDPSGLGTIYAGGTGVPVGKSTDGGSTWTNVQPAPGFYYALASASGVTYAAGVSFSDGSSLGIFKTANGGTLWTPVNNGLASPFPHVYSLLIDPTNTNTVMAGTDSGFFISIDGGSSWSIAPSGDGGTNSTGVPALALAITPSRRVVAAVNPSLFVRSLASAPSVSAVNPPNGATPGGIAVTVSGGGFVASSGLRVLFGGVDGAVNLGASSSSAIAVTTPAHAAGTVDVEVIIPDGQHATLAGGFTYAACTYTIAPLFANYSSSAANGATVQVTTLSGCSWTAAAQGGSFVTITGGVSGTGNGTVTYDVAANGTSAARLTTLTIAGNGFEVDQSANGIAAMTLTATAISGSQVDLSWTVAAGATGYGIIRSQNGGSGPPLVFSMGTSYSDTTVTAGVGYVYRIIAYQDTTTISYSNVDLAVPFAFTNPSLGVGAVVIQAVDFNEVRQVLNAARAAAGWPAFPFTDTLTAGVFVKRIHLMEPRSVLDGVRAAFGLTPISYTDPTVTAGVTVIKGGHIQQIRDGVK